jgi:Predicted esterase of the alpha-beta hydrolase superfamily
MKIGLVLEGGSVRGIYTAGVLDVLMDNKIEFDYVIGVSAGACHASSFISKQRGRAYITNTDYLTDKRYISFRNYFKTKSVFGMDFMFDEIPNRLNKFDLATFKKSKTIFKIGTTDVNTGKPVYFDKKDLINDSKFSVLRASISIPIYTPIVDYKGGKYLDGGTSDPIPVKKAFEDGCDKVIVVATRERSFVKSKEKGKLLYKWMLRKYPKMIETMNRRHDIYNDTLDYIREMEKQGKVLVIAPSEPLNIGRLELNKVKMEKIYTFGINDVKNNMKAIKKFIKKDNKKSKCSG